jgi:hypothetical protein
MSKHLDTTYCIVSARDGVGLKCKQLRLISQFICQKVAGEGGES